MHDDPKAAAKKVRNTRQVEELLRQFLKLETGLGKNAAYNRGHTFNFEWSQEQRDVVNKLMETGMSFEEAFDAVTRR